MSESEAVFVDRTGRRRRLMTLAGVLVATCAVLLTGVVVLSLTGRSGGLLPSLPEAGRGPATGSQPAGSPSPQRTPAASPVSTRKARETSGTVTSAPATTAPGPSRTPTGRTGPTHTPSHPGKGK